MVLVRLFRGLLIAALALCAVLAILVLGLNLYLGLPGTQAALRGRLSAALGVPVSFRDLSCNAVKGATAADLQVIDPASTRAPVLLQAPSALVTYAPLALAQHRVLLRQIQFGKPVVTLEAGAAGRFVLPPRPDGPEARRLRAARLIVKSVNAADGTLRIVDQAGTEAVRVSGVALGGRYEQGSGEAAASGQFTASELAIAGLRAANLQGVYALEKGVLKLTKGIGTAYHGQLAGTGQLATRAADYAFDWQFQASAIDLNEMLKAAFAQPDIVSGILALSATGRKTSDDGWTAQGSLDLRDGQLIRIDFVEELATILGAKELSQPDFATAHADFSLEGGKLALTGIDLEAANFALTGTGTADLAAGTAAFDLQLLLRPDLLKQIPPAVAAQLAVGADGTRTLHVTVAGPLPHLRTEPPLALKPSP